YTHGLIKRGLQWKNWRKSRGSDEQKKQGVRSPYVEYRIAGIWTVIKPQVDKRDYFNYFRICNQCTWQFQLDHHFELPRKNSRGNCRNQLFMANVLSLFILFCHMGCVQRCWWWAYAVCVDTLCLFRLYYNDRFNFFHRF